LLTQTPPQGKQILLRGMPTSVGMSAKDSQKCQQSVMLKFPKDKETHGLQSVSFYCESNSQLKNVQPFPNDANKS
jgi:hypothetical protein